MEYFYLIYIATLYKIYNLIITIKQHATMQFYAVIKREIMQTLLLFHTHFGRILKSIGRYWNLLKHSQM